jgi:N-methylhydantoinase A
VSHRRIYFGAWQEVPVYDFDTLAAGQVVEGPAIVESSTTTVLLRTGDRAEATPLGWLDISVPDHRPAGLRGTG